MEFVRAPCPICGSIGTRDMGRPRISQDVRSTDLAHAADDVRILQCRQCRFYYCSPRVDFTSESMASLYDDEYFGEASGWYERCRRLTVPERNVERLERLCDRRVQDFLEVGSGEGFVLEAAKRKGWNPLGIEVSPAFVEPVSRRLGVRVLLGELEELGLPDESADIVYVNSVLEHVARPEAFLRECRRIVRPGGIAYFLVPNEDSLYNDFRHVIFRLFGKETSSRLDPFRTPYHTQGFTPQSLRLLLERTGLKVLSLEVGSGTSEIRKVRLTAFRQMMMHLVLHPIFWLGERTGRGISIVTVVARDDG